MKNQKGFTLIELLIVVVIVGIVVVIASPTRFKTNHSEAAKVSMATYLNDLYPDEVFNISCTGMDTDGDGYVSCTAVGRNDTSKKEMAECAVGRFNRNSGCKAKMMIRG